MHWNCIEFPNYCQSCNLSGQIQDKFWLVLMCCSIKRLCACNSFLNSNNFCVTMWKKFDSFQLTLCKHCFSGIVLQTFDILFCRLYKKKSFLRKFVDNNCNTKSHKTPFSKRLYSKWQMLCKSCLIDLYANRMLLFVLLTKIASRNIYTHIYFNEKLFFLVSNIVHSSLFVVLKNHF